MQRIIYKDQLINQLASIVIAIINKEISAFER